MPDRRRVRPADRATPKNSAGHGLQNDYGTEPAGRASKAPFHAGSSGRQQRVFRDPYRVKKGYSSRRRGIAAVEFTSPVHLFFVKPHV